MNMFLAAVLAVVTPLYVPHNRVPGNIPTMTNIQSWAASLDLSLTNKVDKPTSSVPTGYVATKAASGDVEWQMVPSTNIVGYLGYIRDLSGNAYRVIAETNPAGSVVASVEQTSTVMPIITIDEEYARATNAEARLYASVTNSSVCATNYTDTSINGAIGVLMPLINERVKTNDFVMATNDLNAAIATEESSRITADNALWTGISEVDAARVAGDTNVAHCATNYTDSATNALSLALVPRIVEVAEAGTNYTDSVFSAVPEMVTNVASSASVTNAGAVVSAKAYADGTFLPTGGGTMTGDLCINRHSICFLQNEDVMAQVNPMATRGGLQFYSLISPTVYEFFGPGFKKSSIVPDDTPVATHGSISNAFPIVTNSYTKAQVDNFITVEADARADADALLIPLAQKAAANGVATLDWSVKVPYAQIPNDAKNMQVYEALESFPPVIEGITNRLYVAKNTGFIYRFDPVAGYTRIAEGGSSGAVWGSITGSIGNQTDLVTALAGKQNNLPAVINDYYLHANEDTGELEWKAVTGGGGTGNYNELTNKPKIGGVTLIGNKTLSSLGIQSNLVFTAAENGKVLGVVNTNLAWVTGGGGGGTNENYREKIDYAYYAEDYYDLEPLKEALGIDYAYLVLADEKFRKHSTSTHWRWYMYNSDFEMIGRSQEYTSPENAHPGILNIECALGWAFLYKKATPGSGIKTDKRIITELEAGIPGGYQTNLNVAVADEGKVLGIKNYKLSWVEQTGGSGGPTDTLILNGDEDIITGPYVIPHGYGEEGQMLVSKGTNAPPEWSDQPIMVLNGTITNAIGPVVIPGGYGQKGQILVGNNNSSPTWLSSGTIGSILTSNGEGANPAWLSGDTAGKMLVSGGVSASPSWKGTETLTFTKSSYVSGGTIKASKFGNVVVINFENIKVSSTSAGMLLGNLSGSFPSSQRACQVCKTSGNIGLVTVESDGRVQAWNMLTDDGYWGSITYIID